MHIYTNTPRYSVKISMYRSSSFHGYIKESDTIVRYILYLSYLVANVETWAPVFVL